MIKSADFVGGFYRTTFCMSHDRFYPPILSAVNLAAELGSNFADKIGRFYRSSVIGLRLQDLTLVVNPISSPDL